MRKLTAIGMGLAVATFGFTALAEDAPKAAPDAGGGAAATSTGDSGVPISFGLRVGYALPMGDAAKNSKMSDFAKGAIPFTLDAVYRINRALRVGLYFSYAIVSINKDKLPSGADASASWLKYGLQLQYHISPDASMDPWVGYGIGMESVKQTLSAGSFSADQTISGLEFAHIMAGLNFKASGSLSVGPFVDFSLGQYSKVDPGGDITDKGMHQWLYLGLGGYYDL